MPIYYYSSKLVAPCIGILFFLAAIFFVESFPPLNCSWKFEISHIFNAGIFLIKIQFNSIKNNFNKFLI
jgi:hypothetical protein